MKPSAPRQCTLILIGLAAAAHAQAPASADLWRLSAASLAGPAALEAGATAAFWNPAAAWSSSRLRAGAQALETPDVLGVRGLVAGAAYQLSPGVAAQVLVGRTDISDLIRTTTSPTSDQGAIPVYEQLAGVGAAGVHGILTAGALLRAHDSRFDAERATGLTVDVGVSLAPGPCRLAAATHFLPIDVTDFTLTDYYAAAQCQPWSPRLWGTASRLFVRYGVSARRGGAAEHGIGAGIELDARLRVDGTMVRETGYVEADWRPAIGVAFQVGRYAITAARSSGLGGIGASYRVGLDVDVVR